MRVLLNVLTLLSGIVLWAPSYAQDAPLNVVTIERPPFAYLENGKATGFSIDMMRHIGGELGREVTFTFTEDFPTMLGAVERGEVDAAIANISITSEREVDMDFSRPIYESGLKVLISGATTTTSIWQIIFRWELMALILLAFGILFGLGMLMWALERRNQPYFNHNAKDAMFPSFWWALNLVINGGFEVTVPTTRLGRLLGVMMVISSLFIVSIFVANITAAMTVKAISGSIQSLDDLDGRRVATTAGSTASAFLSERQVQHRQFASYQELIEAFEAMELDAVVFDGPILEHYLTQVSAIDAHLLERVFRPEDYGIALPQGSDLREPINRILLRMAETGKYTELTATWFGK